MAVSGDGRNTGFGASVSRVLYRHPWSKLLLLLLPAVLWLVVFYLGSITGLLVNSFWRLEEFTGLIDRTLTLSTYGDLFEPYNRDIVLRTFFMAAGVTIACAILAFPLAYFMARYADSSRPVRSLSGRADAVVVELPRAGTRLAPDLRARRRALLGIRESWARRGARRRDPCPGDRWVVVDRVEDQPLRRLHLPVAAVHDPASRGRARASASLIPRGIERSRRAAACHVPSHRPCRSRSPA